MSLTSSLHSPAKVVTDDVSLSLVAQDSMVVRLRTATRLAHKDMETVPALVRLLAQDLTTDEYVAVLRQAGAFYLGLALRIEAALAMNPAAHEFLDGARLHAMAADLSYFGFRELLPAPGSVLPALGSEAAAIGALYMVEGSDLGGRVIAKRLSDSLGLTPETGGRFYGGHDANSTRVRWLRFCDLLQLTAGQDAEAAAAMIDGAGSAFRHLEAWMRRIPAPRPAVPEIGMRTTGVADTGVSAAAA